MKLYNKWIFIDIPGATIAVEWGVKEAVILFLKIIIFLVNFLMKTLLGAHCLVESGDINDFDLLLCAKNLSVCQINVKVVPMLPNSIREAIGQSSK